MLLQIGILTTNLELFLEVQTQFVILQSQQVAAVQQALALIDSGPSAPLAGSGSPAPGLVDLVVAAPDRDVDRDRLGDRDGAVAGRFSPGPTGCLGVPR